MSSALTAQARLFVGRNAELLALLEELDEAASGRGRACLLVGEPGIGKTRLCDELAHAAQARGMRVCFGRAWQAGGAPAYFPWLDTLTVLCDALEPAVLKTALGDGASALAELVPNVRARLPDVARELDSTSEQARFRLYTAVVGLVRAVTSEHGALIVLDDLHAADAASLRLLHFLARQSRGLRALVLATCRDADARLEGEVERFVRELGRECRVLALGRLEPADAEALLQARAGTIADELRAQAATRAQGNPLFLEELARALRLGKSAASELPSGVRGLIAERLGFISTEVRKVLELCAVFGDEVNVELLTLACGAGAPHDALIAAEHAGIVVAQAAQPLERYRFSHALIRDALVNELDDARRRELHARWAHTLSAQRPELDAELAHHFLHAGELAQGVTYAERAAEQALRQFAEQDAQRLLERTAHVVAAHASDPRLLARCEIALARVHILHGRSEEGRALCHKAAQTARALGDAQLLAQAALARGLDLTAALIDGSLVELLQEALRALPEEDSTLRVQVMARLAAAMQPHPDLMYPIGLAREAIAAARRLGDDPTLLGALYTGMSAMMDIVDAQQRMPLNLEVEKLALSAGDPEKVLRTQGRLAFDHMELGELGAADARIAQLERLAQAMNARRYLWRVPLFRSMRALMHGRFAQAEAELARARSLGEAAADPQHERTCVFHHEGLLRAAERHEAMIAFDPEARRFRAALYSGAHWQNGGSAFTCSRTEDLVATARYLALVPQDDWPLVHNPSAFLHLGEPLALCGTGEALENVYELLLPARERCVSWGFTKVLWEGTASRVLGLLAARLGRAREADEHFMHAIEWLERLDAQPFLARSCYEYGRALATRGEPAQRALGFITRGHEIACSLGMTGLVRLCERRMQGVRAPASMPAPSPSVPRTPSMPSMPSTNELVRIEREADVFAIHFGARCVRLKDSLGLRYLARLIATPSTPISALELSQAQSQAEEGLAADAGDAGEHLDQRAREEYRARVAELREQLAEAEREHAIEAAEHARAELEFLAAELSRAVGLSGRNRRAGSAGERARSAVQRRVKSALERIREASPEIAQALELTIKTGTSCEYRPELYRAR